MPQWTCSSCRASNPSTRKSCASCNYSCVGDKTPRLESPTSPRLLKKGRKESSTPVATPSSQDNAKPVSHSPVALTTPKISKTSHHSASSARSHSKSASVELTPEAQPLFAFHTAAGKKVEVSAAGRKYAQSLLGDEMDRKDTKLVTKVPQLVTTDDATPDVKERIIPGQSSSQGEVGSFTFETASGKSVGFSSATLKRASSLLLGTDDKPSVSSFETLFQFGNGKKVTVLQSNLEKAKVALSDSPDEEDNDASSSKKSSEQARRSSLGMDTSTPSIMPTSNMRLTAAPKVQETSSVFTQSSANNFITPARSTFGKRKSFTTPRLVAGTTTIVFSKSATTLPDEIAVESPSTVVQERSEQSGKSSGARPLTKLVKISIDSSLLMATPTGCSTNLHPQPSLDQLEGHQFPAYVCSPPLLELFGVSALASAAGLLIGNQMFRQALLALGAVSSGCPLEWVSHHIYLIKWKLLKISRFTSSNASPSADKIDYFTPLYVLVQICYRYNVEYVDGERSILRKICEKDSPPNSPMVLYLHSIRPKQGAPHTVTVDLSDGWYVATCTFDVPLSQLVTENVLVVGQKLCVCGASGVHDAAAGPLEISPGTELLAIGRNAVSHAGAGAALGALPTSNIPVLPLGHIHPQGGIVPAVEGVVTRVLTPYYVQTIGPSKPSAGTPAPPGGQQYNNLQRIIRNSAAHARAIENIEKEREIAYEKAMESMSREDAADLMKEKFTQDVSMVLTIIVESGSGEAVAIQHFSRNGGSSIDDSSALPKEGSKVVFHCLHPGRFDKCGPPLFCKVLYARSGLMFRALPDGPVSPKSFLFSRQIRSSLLSFGESNAACCLPDLCVVVIGFKIIDKRRSAFLISGAEKNVFGVVHVTQVVGSRDILLVPPTSGTCALIQNVRFVGLDDSLENSVYRFQASEYTAVVANPRHPAGTSAIKEMELHHAEATRANVALGQRILQDEEKSLLWLRGEDKPTEVAVFEGAVACVTLPSSIPPSSLRGPKYLFANTSSPPSSHNSGVKISAAAAINYTPFGGVRSSAPTSAPPQQQDRPQGDDAQRHVYALPPPLMSPITQRHVFGNVLTVKGIVHLQGRGLGANYDLFSTDIQNMSSPSDLAAAARTPSRSEATSSQNAFIPLSEGECILEIHFDGGPEAPPAGALFADAALETLLLAAVGTTSIQPFLALSVDEDHYKLSLHRCHVLSQQPSESAKWTCLLKNSVVLSKHNLDCLKSEIQSVCVSSSAEKSMFAEVEPSRFAHFPRWNDRWVAPNDVLWWSDTEWAQVQQAVTRGLEEKLFKLTWAAAQENGARRVEKCYLVKDKCPIATLFL